MVQRGAGVAEMGGTSSTLSQTKLGTAWNPSLPVDVEREQAIKDRKLISFEQLTATSDEVFYGGDNNPNYNQHYAQARYLCYYLQEKGRRSSIASSRRM